MKGLLVLVRWVSLRYLFDSPLRTALTAFGVALGVAMMVGVFAANGAVNAAFDEMAERFAGGADFVVEGTEAGIPAALVEELSRRSDLVAHIGGHLEEQTVAEDAQGRVERVLVLGLDFTGDEFFLPLESTAGADALKDPIPFLNDPKAVLVGDTFAKRHDLQPGSELRMRTLRGMEAFHVAGIVHEKGKAEAFGGQLVVAYLLAAQLAFGREDVVDRIEIALADGVNKERGKQELAALVGDRGKVGLPFDRVEQVLRMSQNLEGATVLQGFSSLIVGLFLVYNTVSISVTQRRRSIGLLRCIAGTRGQVATLFFAEAAVIGLFGSILGVLGGRWLAVLTIDAYATNFSRVYESIAPPAPEVKWWLATAGIVLGVSATLFAALRPISEAVTASPVESLKRDASRGPELPYRKLLGLGVITAVAGAALTKVPISQVEFVGVSMVIVAGAMFCPALLRWCTPTVARWVGRFAGPSAQLGIDNITRELGRSSTTVGALVLATGMTVMITIYTFSYQESVQEWLDGAMAGDVLVLAGSPMPDQHALPFSPQLREQLADVPGIMDINAVRTVRVTAYDMRINLMSTGTETYLSKIDRNGKSMRRVLDGPSPLPHDALSRKPAVAISEAFARRTGLGAGDRVQLPSPTGTHDFDVVAVVADYSTNEGWMLLDRKYLEEYWRDARVDGLVISLAPGGERKAASDRIRDRLANLGPGNHGMFVITLENLQKGIMQSLRETLEVSKASELVALIVALLGVMGTMLTTALDRRRELALLRALGATRRQAATVLLAEAGYLGAVAAVVGTLAAVPAAFLFVRVAGLDLTGWSVPFSMPAAPIARVMLAVAGVALAAGILPGRRAARMSITKALTVE